jgi:XTP/dITP diphosphohydrolase
MHPTEHIHREADQMPTILLATGNVAKQAKLRWLIDGLGVTPVTPRDLGVSFDPPETGQTHLEVAQDKALGWADRTGELVIASDGGLDIPALGASWNSLFTRRAAGDLATDYDRADHLLRLMHGLVGPERDTFKNEAVAIASPGCILGAWNARGAVGRMQESYDPANIVDGFWFPALVMVPQFGKVLAEVSPEEAAQVDDAWNTLYRDVRAAFPALLATALTP